MKIALTTSGASTIYETGEMERPRHGDSLVILEGNILRKGPDKIENFQRIRLFDLHCVESYHDVKVPCFSYSICQVQLALPMQEGAAISYITGWLTGNFQANSEGNALDVVVTEFYWYPDNNLLCEFSARCGINGRKKMYLLWKKTGQITCPEDQPT
ncbi:MAG TPA: hypothetical protein VK338_04065 [Candidatus Nitrosocosmicus sp.]|nr:hypothetical protein [Candidatus Nitrosocosmicus sp.]